MLKRLILSSALIVFATLAKAYTACTEISMSTCVGDFADGGDLEEADRLLGNTSNYAFSILQGNYVRIHIASGTRRSGYDAIVATPATAGYVGIWTDGVTQIPQYTLDVWGKIRSTDSVHVATSKGGLSVSTIPTNPDIKFIVGNGSITLNNGSVGIGITTPTYKLQVNGDIGSSGTVVSRGVTMLAGALTFPDGTSQTTAIGVAASTAPDIVGLVISTSGVNTDTITVRIDKINIMGDYYYNVSTSASFGKAGAAGLVFGTDKANGNYTLFMNSNGSTPTLTIHEGCVVNPSSVPGNFNKWVAIGDVYNDGSSNLRPFYQNGRSFYFSPGITFLASASPATADTRVATNINISTFAPIAYFYLNVQDDSSTNVKGHFAPQEATTVTDSESSFHVLATGATDAQMSLMQVAIPMMQSRDIKYRVSGATPASYISIVLNGYIVGRW